jgi:hypothetical protein
MPEVEDKISLQEQFSLYKIEIIDGLKMAEPDWDASRVFKLSESSIRSDINVEEVAFSRGQKFFWMIFKGKKGISVLRDVEWTGKEPLLGFLYSCIYEGLEIKFFLPKKCGNIALLEKKVLPRPKVEVPQPPPPPRYVEPPPPPRYAGPPQVDYYSYNYYPPPPPSVYEYSFPLPPFPPFPPFPFFFYDEDRYDQRRGYQQRGYQQRGYQHRGYQHRGYQQRGYQQRGYQPRYHQPRVHTPAPRVRPPGVQTR